MILLLRPVMDSAHRWRGRWSLPVVTLIVLLAAGVGVRVLPGLFTSFPMGDGGLFAVMAGEIRAADWALPMTTSYNDAGIPFTYPPLGLYVLAAWSAMLGQTPIQVMDWWPPLLTVASMGAAWLLLSQITDRWTAAWATAVFALMPRSYEWLVVGGGAMRALGFVLAMLALAMLLSAARRRSVARALAAGGLAGLTVLTHPEATAFGLVSAAAFVVLEWRYLARYGRAVALAAPVALLVVAPWLAVAVSRYGIEPYLGASGSHNQGWTALHHFLGLDTGSPLPVDPVKLIGAAGFVTLLVRRSWFIPAWYGVITLTITGAGPTYAMLPFGLAVVVGARWLAGVLVARWQRPVAAAVMASAVVLAALAVQQPSSPTRQVSAETRQVMAWISENTPPDARFAVVSGLDWWADTESEWFPALTGRVSVGTAQGREWLDEASWNGALDAHEGLQECADGPGGCLATWQRAHLVAVDYVWRRGDASLVLDNLVLAHPSGVLAAWRPQPPVPTSPASLR